MSSNSIGGVLMKRLLSVVLMVAVLSFSLASIGVSESAETEWIGLPWLMSLYGYDIDQGLMDEIHGNFQPQTFDCGEVKVTLKEVLYDGVWMLTASTVVPKDGANVIIQPYSADMDDFIAGGYQENLRDDPRTFRDAAIEEQKDLLVIKFYAEEYLKPGYYFVDHRQDKGEQSTLYSGAPIVLPEENNAVHYLIETWLISPATGKQIAFNSYSFPVEIQRTESQQKNYHSVDADAPFENATLVMTPLATHILPKWKSDKLMQTSYYQLLDENGDSFPRGLPQDITTCFLTEFPDRFIVRFEDVDEKNKDVLFILE